MDTGMTKPLVVFGGGAMAKAILLGACRAGVITPHDVLVCDPDSSKHRAFMDTGMLATASCIKTTRSIGSDTLVLLAIKPQHLPELATQLRDAAALIGGECVLSRGHHAAFVSILAGRTRQRIAESFGIDEDRIARAMPNTPAQIGAGITALTIPPTLPKEFKSRIESLFNGVGSTVSLSESLMDAFTALAGSGPAYLFYLAEAMINGAVAAGIDLADADLIVRQTLLGSAQLLVARDLETGELRAPISLRAAVTSKGGTTEAAIAVFDANNTARVISQAIVAGRDRGRALNG